METCSILSSNLDCEAVYLALKDLAKTEVAVAGNPREWDEITLTRKRLLGKSVVKVVRNVDPDEIAAFRENMRFVFSTVPTSHPAIRKAVVNRIEGVTVEIKVSGHRLVGMEDIVFAVAKAVGGMIFWDRKQLLDSHGTLILDTAGNCRLQEFDGAKADDADPDLQLVAEDAQRKKTSDAVLKARKLPVNPALLPPFSSTRSAFKSLETVADRCMALIVVALRGEGLDKEIADQIVADYCLAQKLSNWERAFLADPDPSSQARIDATWRYEAAWTLLWVLKKVDDLPFPDQICDPAQVVHALREGGNAEGFSKQCGLRDLNEILDAADLHLRLHWVVVSARIKQQPIPENLQPSVVYERLYALRWVLGSGEDWDHVMAKP